MLRNYVIVTASYWGFTLVDGALRMLVLLHFFHLGYSPFTLAFLFLLYEAAGIAANLGGGWLASRFGIPRMLATGQILQIAGLLMLSALDPGWSAAVCRRVGGGRAGHRRHRQGCDQDRIEIGYQGDVVEGSGQLFRWVAWFTGSKNAMKGVGFFVGGLLLEVAGFKGALWLMAGFLARYSDRRHGIAAQATRQGRIVKVGPRAVRQIAKRQSSGGRAHLPVRRARCVVRRWPSGVSLCQRLALPRGRRVSLRSGRSRYGGIQALHLRW